MDVALVPALAGQLSAVVLGRSLDRGVAFPDICPLGQGLSGTFARLRITTELPPGPRGWALAGAVGIPERFSEAMRAASNAAKKTKPKHVQLRLRRGAGLSDVQMVLYPERKHERRNGPSGLVRAYLPSLAKRFSFAISSARSDPFTPSDPILGLQRPME